MRYFLTLPIAAVALATAPAMAQDAATPPEEATTQAPPVEPAMPDPATPPVDPTDAMPPVAAPTETTPPAPTPTTPPAPSANASASLTVEQKAAYDAWPAATKTYFDALTPARQQLFLRIADADKAKLVALPAAQQETVWMSLEKQAMEQKAKQPAGN